MLARVATFAIDGVAPRQVWVEVDIRSGLPAFTIVGLGRHRGARVARPDPRGDPQLRLRVPAARGSPPTWRPAFLRKAGPGFDAALALAVLAASGQVPAQALGAYAVFGELSLGGELRDSPGRAGGRRGRAARRAAGG